LGPAEVTVHWIDKQWHGHTVVCKRFFLVRPGLASLPNTGSPGTTDDKLKSSLTSSVEEQRCHSQACPQKLDHDFTLAVLPGVQAMHRSSKTCKQRMSSPPGEVDPQKVSLVSKTRVVYH